MKSKKSYVLLLAPFVLASFWQSKMVSASEIANQNVTVDSSANNNMSSKLSTSNLDTIPESTSEVTVLDQSTILVTENVVQEKALASSEIQTDESIIVSSPSGDLSASEDNTLSEGNALSAVGAVKSSFQSVNTDVSSNLKTAKQETVVSLAAQVAEPVTATVDDKGISIQYNELIPQNTSILFAVWGDKQNQNDLVWYNASSTGYAYVDFSRHKEYGVYHIHTYAKRNGNMYGINALQVTLLTPQITSQIAQKDASSFTITVSNVPSTITRVKIPVWTDKDGQNDLIWYNAGQVSKGTYQALVNTANHNNEKGLYHIHIYGYSTILGGQIGLATKTFSNVESRPNATVSVVNYAENKTTFTVNVVGSTNTKILTGVQIAVWSETNGQDDLKWYKPLISGNSASQTIDIANHSNTSDQYIIHVYTDYSDGSRVGTNLGAYKIVKEILPVVKPNVIVQNYQADKGSLEVKVQEGSKAISKISVAAWSTADQSNLHWYQEIPIAGQETIIKVNQAYHDFLVGNYTVHTYIDYTDKSRDGFNLGNYEFPVKVGLSASQGNYDIVNKVIYLDAGHGGYDPGAVYFGTSEKTLNLQMQTLVKSKLEAQGYTVVTTRTDDSFTDLLPRSEKANNSLSDLFVSLHFNASTSSQASGIETYYYEYYEEYPSRINDIFHNDPERLSRSSVLAEAIQAATTAKTGAKNNGVLRNTFAVLRETTAPAVLVELGYMSNASEFQNISNVNYQEKLAQGIVSGILSYYQTYSV